jgi:hypothetical protein
LDIEATDDVPRFAVWVGIGTPGLAPVYTEMLEPENDGLRTGAAARIDIELPLPLPDGDYVLQVVLREQETRRAFGRAGPLPFRVVGRPGVTGLIDLGSSFAAEVLQ